MKKLIVAVAAIITLSFFASDANAWRQQQQWQQQPQQQYNPYQYQYGDYQQRANDLWNQSNGNPEIRRQKDLNRLNRQIEQQNELLRQQQRQQQFQHLRQGNTWRFENGYN